MKGCVTCGILVLALFLVIFSMIWRAQVLPADADCTTDMDCEEKFGDGYYGDVPPQSD